MSLKKMDENSRKQTIHMKNTYNTNKNCQLCKVYSLNHVFSVVLDLGHQYTSHNK